MPPRITQAIDENRLVTLRGNVHPLARPEYDHGAVSDAMPMKRILMLLQRSAEQESALDQLLEDQQNKTSSSYHAWLTPEQFGVQFGPADADLQSVTDWLTSHGFTDIKPGPGRNVIEFSGNVAQVRAAFHTEIHRFVVNGEEHTANTTDPQIPAALSPVVAGMVSLHNFSRKSHAKFLGQFRRKAGSVGLQPVTTFPFPNGPGGNFYGLGPGDFATIYNSKPLISAGNDGTGQTIAIVGETNIKVQDVQQFRSMFGLPANFDATNIVLNGEDPGITSIGEEGEADLDVEWSGAVAPGATIKLVVSASTPASAGVDLSALYVVEHNLAGVMSESYGACESALGSAENAFYNNLWEQAAAQGITAFVSSGDDGSAGCDDFGTEQVATQGLAVSGLASTPFNISVGGTDFDQVNKWANFWNPTNDATGTSAKSYIPEIPWSQNCAQIGLNGCGSTAPNGSVNIVAGSGGPSSLYAKPKWQLGVTGMPNDNHRDQPDVSLFASAGFAGTAYIMCEIEQFGFCSVTIGAVNVGLVGGTSASAPAFAGIMALVNQYQAAHSGSNRQGNANYTLYALAKKSGASCASSATEASTCTFNDVTKGNSFLPTGAAGVGTNSVPCQGGSLNCSVSISGGTGVLVDPSHTSTEAWTVTAGYDMTSGLGSVNVNNLATSWGTVSTVPTSTSLTLSPTTGITHGTGENVTVNITVKANTGTGVPTGDVSLIATFSDGSTQAFDHFTLSSGAITGATTQSLPGGTYNVTAHYAGDGTNAPSDSPSVQVTVGTESSQTFLLVPTFNPVGGSLLNGDANSFVYGTPFVIRMYVTDKNANAGTNGRPSPTCYQENLLTCPTGTVTLTDKSVPVDAGRGGAGIYTLNNAGYTRDIAPSLGGGTHALVAQYNGDNSYQQSVSAAHPLTITPATMQLSLTVPTSTVIGIPFVIYMSGTTSVRGAAPAGTITVYDGTTAIFSVSGPGIGYAGTGSGSTPTAGFGIDTGITLSTLGSHSLTLAYSADPNYSATSTSPQVVRVVYPTTLTLQPSSTTVNYGTSSTLTATLTTTQTSPPVTGQITFASSSGQGTVAPGPTTQTLINGFVALQATATITPQSSDSYVANYAGDSNYSVASATSPYITVNNPDFSVVPSQPGLTITAGQSGNVAITVTPTYALNGTLQLQVPSPVVQGITCSVSPAQIQLSGGNSVTATLSCSVPAPSSSTSTSQIFPRRWLEPGPRDIWWKMSGMFAALTLVLCLLPVRLRLRRLVYTCLLLGTISFVMGCGGASAGPGSGGGSATPTTTSITVPSTKVSGSNLAATVQVTGTNSPTGPVSFGVVGESYSFNTAPLVNGAAQFSYYLGAPGAFLMTAQYSGDSRNLPSQVHTPLSVVQTGLAGNVTVNAIIGPTLKQTSIALTIQ